MRFISFLLALSLICTIVSSQITAKDAVLQMQRGINIGDSLDAPDGETSWGNPLIEEYYFDDFKAAGINAVRLPVTWNKHTGDSSPYTIDPTFISRVEEIVDWALARNLYVCLNAHHEGWLKNTKECVNGQCGPTLANQDRFNSIWQQIADRFKEKSYLLMFEILNEPETMPTPTLNQIHRRVVQTIRASGGNNGKRLIVFSGTLYSAAEQLVQVDVPEDDHTYLIANYHTYCPWSFVSDSSGTARWGTQADKDGVKAIFDMVKAWSNQHQISIMFNEWGAGFDKHEYKSEMDFYQYYVKGAVDYGYGCFVWDDNYDFKTYERTNRKWHGELIDVLTNPVFSSNGMRAIGWFDSSGVNRYPSSDGSHYVGDFSSGRWVAYRLDIPSNGAYKLELVLANREDGSVLLIESENGKSLGTVNLKSAGSGEQDWITVPTKVSLQKGVYNLVLKMESGKVNLKALTMVADSNTTKVNVTGVSMDKKVWSVNLNSKIQVTASILPNDATNTDMKWESSNQNVVDIDDLGVVTGKSEGQANVTVTTIDGGFQDTAVVSVVKPSCPEWQPNTNYPIGTVVSYNGETYTSTNDWNGGAGDPYTATHNISGWGWKIGGSCSYNSIISKLLQKLIS